MFFSSWFLYMFSPSSDINPCHSLFFDRDHLRSDMGIISGPGSFAVQFGDHLRSRIICGPAIICWPVQIRFQDIVYLKFNKWWVEILKNGNKKNSTWCTKLVRKQEIILFLYRATKCPTEAENIDFAKMS